MIQKKITCHRVLCRILGRRRLPAGTDYLLEVRRTNATRLHLISVYLSGIRHYRCLVARRSRDRVPVARDASSLPCSPHLYGANDIGLQRDFISAIIIGDGLSRRTLYSKPNGALRLGPVH